MKRTVQRVWLVLIGAMLLYWLVPCIGFANVCSQGAGVPPFLSSGAKPNLLMVIDNSGSMLDAAYSDSASFCFDDTYATGNTYGGYFEQDTWYKWVGPGTDASYSNLLSPWEGGHSYTQGDRVYANGIIWEARTTDTSSAVENIAEDIGIAWKKITFDNVDKWFSSASYTAGKTVWYGPQMYRATASSTNKAPDGADGGSYWKTVDSTWENGKSYSAGNIVSYKGRLYTANAGGTSSGTGVYDDTGVVWNLLKEGSFVAVTSGEATSYCSGASGSAKYTLTDNLCISLDVNKNPDQVSAFAARGNFLNWAMASKFDVEKKILTGGRYDPKDDLMMTEHRGCSGSRMVKQIQMDGSKFLSLAVRGSRHLDNFSYEDRVDSTDDTARLEVLAITDSGYTMSEECQDALDKIMSNDGDLNGTQNSIDQCVESFDTSSNELTDMRPALNHSLQACWQDDPATEEFEINNGKLNSLTGLCEAMYTGGSSGSFTPSRAYTPSELRPKDGGPYICYGIYDPNIDDTSRVGYMGRVWVSGGGGGTVMKYCNPKQADGECSSPFPCYWKAGPTAGTSLLDSSQLNYRNNFNLNGYVEKCTAISGSGGDTITCAPQKANNECSGENCCWGGEEDYRQCTTYRNNADGNVEECILTNGKNAQNEQQREICEEWKVIANWDDGSGLSCNYPDDGPISTSSDAVCTEWKIQGRWSDNSSDCTYGVDDPVAIGTSNAAEGTWESDDGVLQAIKAYCDVFKIPEVVDPSDAAGKTGETGGVPGLLRDSELMAFVGGGDPLATMKGYISEDTRPEGIIQSVAGDLRLGGMAFHSVGAATECEIAKTDTTSKIDKYCPLNNMDGAELLVELKDGELVTQENDSTYTSGKRRHVDDLAQAINDIRATSWTPLAEAMYGALGYYTQNDEFCLNFDANNKCLDWCLETDSSGNCTNLADDDPVQYWCQDNHILLITEGESTADINAEITAFQPTGTSSYVTDRSSICACHPDNMDALGQCYDDKFSGDGGTTDTACTGSLYSSTYLDDMTWWGQNIRSLYKKRCVADPDGRETEKSNIFTHVVTTGVLTAGGSGECDPATLMTAAAMNGSGGKQDYYPGENPDDLEDNLMAVLDDILSRASAGSAASVISSSRSGSGAVYQAVFWPEYEYEDAAGKTKQVSWVGNVHSLFMNAEGGMYEDADHDGKLDETKDKRVMFYFSNHVNKTRGCYDTDYFVANATCPDDGEEECDPTPTSEGGAGHSCVEIDDINYLWSANNYLEGLADDAVHTARKIFTWNDANNDGMVDDNEWFRLTDTVKWDDLNAIAKVTETDSVTGNERGPVSEDFLTKDDWANFVSDDGSGDDDASMTMSDYEYDALNALIGWLHGEDQLNNEAIGTDTNSNDRRDKELRSRYYEKGGKGHTWRLGDVIHSTPIVVSRPAEAYNYIYRDPTYNDFVDKWSKRRSVVYFGANDGMLHAVNTGFYFESGNKFCCTNGLDSNGDCDESPYKDTTTGVTGICDNAPNLGEELWAYIPYNLQPHLKCLASKLYTHKYFVDQKPRIFDVQIFAEEAACKTSGLNDAGCIHPGGWGTILVGAMRFGGAPVLAESLNKNSDDKREFTSSFFILDITNPEADLTASGAKPLLLGEMTRTTETKSSGLDRYTDLNYTTSIPAMVIMRDGAANAVTSKWYLAMGNGPTEQSGRNTDQAKIAFFPLERLKGQLDWSTVAGSGPGSAGRPTKYNNKGKGAFRILNQEPSNDGFYEIPGRFLVPKAVGIDDPADTITRDQPGFISDIISVDYNIDMTAPDDLGARYRTDAIYFGTTDGGDFAEYLDKDAPDDQFYWNGSGRLFRLVTKVMDKDTKKEKASAPSDWAGLWPTSEPSSTQNSSGPIRMLLDVKRPITAGPSIGYDGENYWIYAGTGRFWDELDKTDDGWCIDGPAADNCWDASSEKRVQAAMFGVKEPTADDRSVPTDWGWDSSVTPSSVACDDKIFTWQTIDWDRNSQDNTKLAPANAPGKRGLMKTDDILVASGSGILDCQHCTTNVTTNDYDCVASASCFTNSPENFIDDLIKDGGDYTFDKLEQYIAGDGCDTVVSLFNRGKISPALYNKLVFSGSESDSISTGIDGWYNEFHDPRERNLGATALLGGLLTFTSYQPFNDKCKAEGQSFLYGLYYKTGTAWTKSVFGTFDESDGSIKQDGSGNRINPKLSLGRGLSTTPSMHVGSSDDHAAKAFIQTSTGEIIEVTQEELPYTNTKSGRMGWTDRCE